MKPFTLKVFRFKQKWTGTTKRILVLQRQYDRPEPMLADASIYDDDPNYAVITYEPNIWVDTSTPPEPEPADDELPF